MVRTANRKQAIANNNSKQQNEDGNLAMILYVRPGERVVQAVYHTQGLQSNGKQQHAPQVVPLPYFGL